MGKSSPKAPAAADPVATAAAQTQSNKDTAYWNAVLNNVNQITPYGTLSYEQSGGGKKYNEEGYTAAMNAYNAGGQGSNPYTGYTDYIDRERMYFNPTTGQTVSKDVYDAAGGATSRGQAPKREDFFIGETPPEFTATTTLSPEQQALYNSQTSQQQQLMDLGGAQIGRIQENANTPFSYGGIADAPTQETIAQQQARAEEALMSRMNPQFARDEEAMRTRLINQGITQGSEAYNREMEGFGQTKNDARMQAILQGQNYGTNAQQQALQRRNQAIQEYTTQRNAPLNEYNAFTSGTQIQNPQFQDVNYQGAGNVDYAGLVQNKYNADYQNYSNQVASRNQNIGMLGQLAGAGLSFGLGGGGATNKTLFGYNLGFK